MAPKYGSLSDDDDDGDKAPPPYLAAGLLYLCVILCGIYADGLARPSPSTSLLFKSSIMADLAMCGSDACLAVILARVLGTSTTAVIAAALRLLQTAVYASAGILALVAAMIVPNSADLCLRLHASAYQVALVFFGLSCVLNGLLMLRRHTHPPRPFGALFVLAGVGYVLDSLGLLFLPVYDGSLSPIFMTPALVAELGLCIWLLWVALRRPDPV
ncbi:hypothetical protein CTAYLR_003036 [Chrysophaeum taylorii]|uniref:DUF4386 domain-containing protein n=1 Tax=Chrysophaeum taylorii TaxID=2483200 RepID=A0AAD7U6B1_9STRA|nr:hypothetical protein CTAYLR_003036 [Chrysophaeum taylorii]